MKVKNKTILVTGAGGGIGSELVLGLLSRKAKVIAVDLREESLTKLTNTAGTTSTKLTTYPLDITKLSEIKKFHNHLDTKVDGLINCAGIIQPFVKVNDIEYESIEKVMNVNFYGTLYMTKTFLPDLLKKKEAHILNVSSMGGFLPVPGQSIYGASKAAVKLLTEGLYAELLNTSVKVSVAFPGATNTNISGNSNVEAPKVSQKDTSKMASRMLSAKDSAEIILNGLESNKTYIYTGKDSNLMNRLYRINPAYTTRLIAKKMKSLLN